MTSPETFRRLLCELGDRIRDGVVQGRAGAGDLTAVAHESAADTIYAIDKLSEVAIHAWFSAHWPADEPVEIVMEGLDDGHLCFPAGQTPETTKWKCLIDPIDGTRGLMYDKRPAWALAGLAPQRGDATRLSDIFVAAMTELPTTKQWRADQISAVRGGGLVTNSCDVRTGETAPLTLRPSGADDFRHGFSWLVKYFPEGRTLTAQIEEALWDEIVGLGRDPSPVVFDDQYISTGGAFYELLAGHDRLVGDLRPLIYHRLDLDASLVCHPYDVCTALLLEEAGVIYEHPLGGFPDAPMDTTSGVAWVAYANPRLAAQARPVLQNILRTALA
jgi:fructose-1,6-bisphosphatase/inositol monophosphatase family enzyme